MKKAKFVIVLALFSFILLSMTSSCQKSQPTQSTQEDSFAALKKADDPNSPPSIECTNLTVEKTATGFWNKCLEYDWTIEKTVEPTEIEIIKGMTVPVTYTITVNRTKVSENDVFGVSGEIKVTNGGEDPTENLKIVDQVQYRVDDGQFQDLEGASQTIIPEEQIGPGETKSYPYHIEFAPIEGAEYKNRVKVTITNYADHKGEEYGPAAEADFKLPNEPTTKLIDAEADITDVQDCPTGMTCTADDPGPWHVTASDEIIFNKKITNNSAECQLTLELKNKAILKESDTGEERKACATVIIYTGPCDDLGCTLTQGYWKNHTDDWPEGYHKDMDFLSKGETWLEIFNTPPKHGDAYYILAHQFLTAVLNEANGAFVPLFVKETMLKSKAWLGAHNSPVPASSPSGQDAISYAKILDDYNNGKMGVPHCDKDKKKDKEKKNKKQKK